MSEGSIYETNKAFPAQPENTKLLTMKNLLIISIIGPTRNIARAE